MRLINHNLKTKAIRAIRSNWQQRTFSSVFRRSRRPEYTAIRFPLVSTSRQRKIIRPLIISPHLLGDLHEHVVDERARAEAEPLRV
jgi:hypothetical protein